MRVIIDESDISRLTKFIIFALCVVSFFAVPDLIF
jgi:hypothetical protein